MRARRTAWWPVALALVLVALPAAAGADRERARALYQEGARAFDAEEWSRALGAFKRAYREQSAAALLYDIGQAYRYLREYPAAVASFRAYLREQPDAADRAEVEWLIVRLQRQWQADLAALPPQGVLAPSLPAATAEAPCPDDDPASAAAAPSAAAKAAR